MYDTLKDCLPTDHAKQVQSTFYIDRLMSSSSPGVSVLDLGCGVGKSVDVFRKYNDTVDWCGLDIEASPEVNARKRDDAAFFSFDGVRIPFDASRFDIVYSHQVFEHVRRPEELLLEVARVLKPGAAFIGSVSTLEPYHSFSYWNYTPFGWHTLLTGAGLQPVEFRPGIDAIALIQRNYDGNPPEAGKWFKKSPLNDDIDRWAAKNKRSPAQTNMRKLQFCGHLVFHATKP